MNNNKKLNDGCLKIFKFLKLLYNNEAEYYKVCEIFQDEIKETSTNNIQVTLNKYINTLKVFGLKIKKENGKFILENSLYSINLQPIDLNAMCIIEQSLNNFPNKKLIDNVNNLLQEIKFRMDAKDKSKLHSMTNLSNYDFTFYYSNLKEQISECEKICSENFVINLIFIQNEEEKTCKCVPKEVIYDSKNAYLRVYDTITHTPIEVPINRILSITKLPQIASSSEMSTTVVYKLKNRLAKTYKLKENEYSEGFTPNNELIVINKNENPDKLLHRLLRYTYNCEIISPKTLRIKMSEMINKSINNYLD